MVALEHTADELAVIQQSNHLMERGEEIPLHMRRQALEAHLRVDPGRLDLAAQLASVLVEQHEFVPLELEEQSLRYYLGQDKSRSDLRERLGVVQRRLGLVGPLEPEVSADGKQASQTDIDFQREAQFYEETANYGDMNTDFQEILERCKEFTMTSVERMYAMYQSVNYIIDNNIPGAIVECGVWRGGSIMVAIEAMKMRGETTRPIFFL